MGSESEITADLWSSKEIHFHRHLSSF